MLPEKGGTYRADQIAWVSGQVHQLRTDPRIGEWLAELQGHPDATDAYSDLGTIVREARREYDRRVKLPARLVEELARSSVLGQQVWVEARRENAFDKLAPALERIVKLKREEAEAIGYEESPYDALLDEYEPGARTTHVAETLRALRADLVPLVQQIQQSSRTAPTDVLRRKYPQLAQEAFGRSAAMAIGFDFSRGRLDVTHHPFCTELGPNDCRITTRYDESFFPSAFFGILHEAGHGIYEQGLRSDCYGLPTGRYTSLGIHESQSRLWENQVGRSLAFWRHHFPAIQKAFPGTLDDVSLDEWYFAVNDVRPSLIRVEADEATYNLHIIVRFELEQALIAGQLSVADLPSAWNDKYREYLGITPPDDRNGVMQDVHWPAALIGYFPTYTLGNLYAAQFFAQADHDLGGIDALVSQGDFEPLLTWLRTNIHRHGRSRSATELVEQCTARPLGHEPLIRYLRAKLEPLYTATT
jgi:carboxypeptidase Taq